MGTELFLIINFFILQSQMFCHQTHNVWIYDWFNRLATYKNIIQYVFWRIECIKTKTEIENKVYCIKVSISERVNFWKKIHYGHILVMHITLYGALWVFIYYYKLRFLQDTVKMEGKIIRFCHFKKNNRFYQIHLGILIDTR